MEVKELGHVVLYVRDIERSRRFYRDVLGWKEIADFGLKVGTTDDELREAYKALQENGVPVLGTADHTVTHSLYIADPDGNEIELYIDVPGVDWRADPPPVGAPLKPPSL